MSRGRRIAFLGAVAAAALVLPGVAPAAPWCGTTSTTDRPFVGTGYPVRVFYAFPSDGADRSAEIAPRISADVEEIDAWWRAQDPTRTPNFDLTRFSCGLQVDLTVRRLTLASSALEPAATRFVRIRDELFGPRTLDAFYTKYVLYYDGPVEDEQLCGEGGGTVSGTGLAIVYMHACPGASSASVAAHELIHALGALFRSPAPNLCPSEAGHVCDSTADIIYPYASPQPLSAFVLDAGRDDYYGHAQPWFDVQDARWMRHLDASTTLSVAIRGRGSVRSDVPGVLCSTTCRTGWNPETALILFAQPASGQRFVRWSGQCFGSGERCDILLDKPTAVTAHFAPARYPLAVQVAGRGVVAGGGLSCRVRRCVRSVTSHEPVTLRAVPARGWRLKSWTGACRGAVSTCAVPMTAATSVRATFVRRATGSA